LGIFGGPAMRVEVTLIVLFSFIIWVGIDRLLRIWLSVALVMRSNPRWRDVLLDVLDFLMLLFLFVTVQLALGFIGSSVSSSDLGIAESIAGVIVIALGSFALVNTVKTLAEN